MTATTTTSASPFPAGVPAPLRFGPMPSECPGFNLAWYTDSAAAQRAADYVRAGYEHYDAWADCVCGREPDLDYTPTSGPLAGRRLYAVSYGRPRA